MNKVTHPETFLLVFLCTFLLMLAARVNLVFAQPKIAVRNEGQREVKVSFEHEILAAPKNTRFWCLDKDLNLNAPTLKGMPEITSSYTLTVSLSADLPASAVDCFVALEGIVLRGVSVEATSRIISSSFRPIPYGKPAIRQVSIEDRAAPRRNVLLVELQGVTPEEFEKWVKGVSPTDFKVTAKRGETVQGFEVRGWEGLAFKTGLKLILGQALPRGQPYKVQVETQKGPQGSELKGESEEILFAFPENRVKAEYFAEFSFSSTGQRDRPRVNDFLVDFKVAPRFAGLTWEPARENYYLSFKPDIEGKFGSENPKKAKDPNWFKKSVGLEYGLAFDNDPVLHDFVLNGLIGHESDRDFEKQSVFFEFNFLPSVRYLVEYKTHRARLLAIDKKLPQDQRQLIPWIESWMLLPKFGYQIGEAVGGFKGNDNATLSRFVGDTSLTFETTWFLFDLSNKFHHIFNGSRQNANYFEAGFGWKLPSGSLGGANSISLKYLKGRLPPSFTIADKVTLGYQVRF